ncbi:MAG: hypothetical protein GC204_08560 [Chloroflexi bacterium]|nr:hypothetical protein [Chloroflexota bacterium]
MADNIVDKLKEVLKSSQDGLYIGELLDQMNEPFASITAREAIWKLIDQDILELTDERKLRYIGNRTNGSNGLNHTVS